MQQRSTTKRSAPWRQICALALFVIAGCRSGAQTDLVTRELRHQEDQIYAMEDYLSQYQQLLCQARAENAELKRQLAEKGDTETLPAPPRSSGSRSRRSAPAARPGLQRPPQTPADERPALEEEIDIEVIDPEVPPLGAPTSSHTPFDEPEILAASHAEPTAVDPVDSPPETPPTTGVVRLTSVSERTIRPRPETAAAPSAPGFADVDSAADSARGESAPAAHVRLQGEVIANDAGGPRLQVDVLPTSANGEPLPFVGALSMMILDSHGAGTPPECVARWDFTADEVQSLLVESSNQNTVRLHLELPADTQAGEQTQLWVRLLPEAGGKMLEHAAIRLREPGQFASATPRITPSSPLVESVAEQTLSPSYAGNSASVPATAPPRLIAEVLSLDDGWTTARPGQFATAQPRPSHDSNRDWRAASNPLPRAMTPAGFSRGERLATKTKGTEPKSTAPKLAAKNGAATAGLSAVVPAAFVAATESTPAESEKVEKAQPVRTVAAWSPERPGKAQPVDDEPQTNALRQTTSVRPAWSPLR